MGYVGFLIIIQFSIFKAITHGRVTLSFVVLQQHFEDNTLKF